MEDLDIDQLKKDLDEILELSSQQVRREKSLREAELICGFS